VVGGVAHDVDAAVRKCLRQNRDQLTGQPHRGVGALAAPEPEQDRQAHRMRAERQQDNDAQDHPAVAAAERVGVLRGAVVGPERAEDLRPPAPDQGVVDDHLDRRCLAEQPIHDQPGQRQPEPVGIPGVAGKEPARGVKRHHSGGPRPGEHAHHGAARGLRDQTGGQQHEHRERRRAAKRGTTRLQQRLPGNGYSQPAKHRRHPRTLERYLAPADASPCSGFGHDDTPTTTTITSRDNKRHTRQIAKLKNEVTSPKTLRKRYVRHHRVGGFLP
jgi:hypothetical protein